MPKALSAGDTAGQQPARPWHRALVLAITGIDRPELGVQDRPDLDAVTAILAGHDGGLERLRDEVAARRSSGEPWPYPVPAALRSGLGAAQLLAAVAELRRRLELDAAERLVLRDRPPDADERRLLADVPPHHGH